MLVLSLFPGIDLFGRGFEAEGYCVVRGPDPLWGGDIRNFAPPPGRFEGVIGGPPCQDFSALRRTPPSGEGRALLAEFVRCVAQARPHWFLMENVPAVPDVVIPGYTVQRLDLRANEVGLPQRRLRHFQFGAVDGVPLVLPDRQRGPVTVPACVASEGRDSSRRDWAEFVTAQGLPADYDLPGMTREARYRAVGNGVPVPMGAFLARAIRERPAQHESELVTVCVCGCGRRVVGRQQSATAACRKRMQRRRAV